MNIESAIAAVFEQYSGTITSAVRRRDTVYSSTKLEHKGRYMFAVFANGRQYPTLISVFELALHPLLPNVIVFGGVQVEPEFRSLGIGAMLNAMRVDAARASGYGLAMCQVNLTNHHQLAIMAKNGWHKSTYYTNRSSGNMTAIFTRSL